MSQVWIVFLRTGEYETANEVVKGVFSSQDKADAYAAKMNADLDCAGLHTGGDCSRSHDDCWRNSDTIQNQFGIIIYTGADFFVDGPYTVDQNCCP